MRRRGWPWGVHAVAVVEIAAGVRFYWEEEWFWSGMILGIAFMMLITSTMVYFSPINQVE